MDVTQDTFVKALEKEKHIKDASSIKGWLLTIARNLSIDQYRKQKKVSSENDELSLADPSTDEQKSVLSMDLKEIIREAFPTLSARQQEVFALRYYEDMPFAEIAAQMEVSEGTVKTLHHRAITSIRAFASKKWRLK